MGGPWFSAKQNEGMGAISPLSGVCCSSIASGSQPGSAQFFSKTKNAVATPSAAASSSSSSNLIVSISFGSSTLHGATGASPSSISSPVADVGAGVRAIRARIDCLSTMDPFGSVPLRGITLFIWTVI